ncbi:hypothetical protein AA313_de0200162 [Arthrobotrys entomopaga]|nr:hypothetical protein AA313_de0200162 [Arthrobotrys entomopaga]
MDGGQVIVHSAVRLPSPPSRDLTPPPATSSKRKRTSHSPTSPPRDHGRRRSPPPRRMRNDFGLPDVDPERAAERIRQLEARTAAAKDEPAKPVFDPKAEYEKLLAMRSGGTYIPPARLKALQSQITDKSSKEYQRMAWEQLKKAINGLINKVNTSNIKSIVPDLFQENLIRGRGLYCRSIMKAQAAALTYTPVYAAMTAIINTKLPQVGELLVKRLVIQFRKAFKRNDKAVCLSSTTFIAHLVNQQVAHELLALEILMLLLMQNPTDDSVEIAVGFMREVGAYLAEMSTKANEAIYDAFRSILHESAIDKRVQYMIEVLFQVRRDKYKDNPIVREELDLVEEEDQITHQINLSDDSIETQDTLNVFKFDPHYEEHENLYKRTRAEILGEESGSEGGDGSDDDDEDESDEEQDEKEKQLLIQDQSNTNLVNLRRTIYLTIMSSIDFEECCHKLMKIKLPAGQEPELVSMIVECCSQERTYAKFYGNIGERFCKLNRLWQDLFEKSFANYYETIHRYEINRLRNIACFFGHQLANDAVNWQCLNIIHLNEEETTSSSRIFIKILFQNLAEQMTMKKVVERLNDPFLAESFAGLFPRDNPRNTRFAINYFTSIGMGAVTEGLREFLQSIPKQAVPALPVPRQDSDDEKVGALGVTATREVVVGAMTAEAQVGGARREGVVIAEAAGVVALDPEVTRAPAIRDPDREMVGKISGARRIENIKEAGVEATIVIPAEAEAGLILDRNHRHGKPTDDRVRAVAEVLLRLEDGIIIADVARVMKTGRRPDETAVGVSKTATSIAVEKFTNGTQFDAAATSLSQFEEADFKMSLDAIPVCGDAKFSRSDRVVAGDEG